VHSQSLSSFPFLLSSRPHLIFLIALLGLKPKKNRPLLSLPYPLLNLPNTGCGAECYTRAECNTILYDPLPSRQEPALYLYECVLYVRVRVCVCDPDMALLAPLYQHSPLVSLLQIIKRTVFFVLAM
jgi:hypothetical protein